MAHRSSRHVVASLGAAVVATVFAGAVAVAIAVAGAAPAAADEAVVHRPPVDAPVVDPFRPPATAFGPGNRGLTYDLDIGTPVRATAAGEVVFAGWVAGTRHVTVLHADGIRTSYSFLTGISVRRGQTVAVGEVVGHGGQGFHLGARIGDTYIDPAGLFGTIRIEVRLVPHDESLPGTDAGLLRERIALAEVVEDRSRLERFVGWVADQGQTAVDAMRAGYHMGTTINPRRAGVEAVASILYGIGARCTTAATEFVVPPAAGRVALLVGGLGSSSTNAAVDDVDVATLGYRPDDVIRFSYGGGRIPDVDGSLHPALARLPESAYAAADTGADIEAQGRALADLIEAAARVRPDDPIDLYAHSLGGLVVRVALLELAGRPGGLSALGNVVTIGTPHAGADIATASPTLDPGDQFDLGVLGPMMGFDVPIGSPALDQLAETSPLVRRLAADGVPEGVAFRTIGARGDMVVTGDKTSVAGHPTAMVDLTGPTAHGRLPGDVATTRELQLALAGLPPGCRSAIDQVLDATVPELISFGENVAVTGFVAL